MDDRLPPGKETSQCSAGRTEDQIIQGSRQGTEQLPWPCGEGNSQGTGVWKPWLSPMDDFLLRKVGEKN